LSMLREAALVEVQLSVDCAPDAMLAGVALSVTPKAVDTVTEDVAVAVPFVAVMV
jgi:hypothetical protein